jgi:type III secretion protein T
MDALYALNKENEVFLLALCFTLPRVYAFLQASQLLNPPLVPRMAAAAIVIMIGLTICPIHIDFAEKFDHSVATLAVFIAKEYAIGFLLGYLISWVFWAIEAAGAFIDSQRGAAIAEAIDPIRGDQTSLMGNLFSQVFLAYIFTTGSFLIILSLLYKSYSIWRLPDLIPIIDESFPEKVLALFDTAMELAFVIAAPILAIMFLAEFALALLSRFAPQIQVFILAMPIKSILASIFLIFYFAILLPHADKYLASAEAFMNWSYEAVKFQ